MSTPPTTFYSALKAQLVKPGGLALAFASVALSLVAVWVLPTWEISIQALIGVLVVGGAYVSLSATAIRDGIARERALSDSLTAALAGNRYAPRVLQAMPSPTDEGALMLLLEANRLFGQSMLVSLYYEDERGFELQVGSGQVANVQTNGMIQVNVTAWEGAYVDLRRGVIAQEESKIARLLVRPAPTTQAPHDPSAIHAALWVSLQSLIEKQQDDRNF